MHLDYSSFVGHYIQSLAKLFTYRHNTMLEQIGLTYSQFRILCCLWERDDRTQNDILKDTLIKPASLTGLIVTLEKKGYITRERDNSDGRSKVVSLTPKGRALEEASYDIIIALDQQVFEAVPAEDRAALIAQLDQLLQYTSSLPVPELPDSARKVLK